MRVASHVLDPLDYTLLHAYDLRINPCDDCKVCHYKLACKHNDDHDIIIDALKATDTLILTTPIYFGAMSDQLLKVINRFQQLFERKYTHKRDDIKLKKLIVISTCASNDITMFDGLKLTVRILNQLFSVEKTDLLLLNNTDNEDPMITQIDRVNHFKESIKKALI
jgi:multimeric flavodoxin WrbA